MSVLFKIIENLGYTVSNDLQNYYSEIDTWMAWWRGFDPEFHRYKIVSNSHAIVMKRKTMKMAKKVCEDWANLLLNDKTYIEVSDDASQVFLTGDDVDQSGGVLGASKFWKLGNRTVEKEFATGTACMYLDLVDPVYDGHILSASSVRIKYISDARMIVPLSHDNGEITELALASEHMREGKRYFYIQIFCKVDGRQYEVRNYYYLIKTNGTYERVPNLNGEAESYLLPCKPFVVLMPNIENNIAPVPMGLSIYANAIDQLKGCDLGYDNLYNDILLGKKRVFMNQAMYKLKSAYVNDDDNKSRMTLDIPGTIESSLYVVTGDRLPDQQQFIQDYNPSLRVDENKENIQLNLNILSAKVGFGQNRYQFGTQSMATATEVRASNKDLTESVWKQRIQIQEALTDLTRAILIIGKEKCGAPVNPDARITIKFDDTMFADEESERLRMMQEIAAGIVNKYEYRMKYLGEDEETARARAAESSSAASAGIDDMFFGGSGGTA